VFSFVGIHTTVDFARRVTPRFELLANVFERIAVFGEKEKFTAGVRELVELRFSQTLFKRLEFGIGQTNNPQIFRLPSDWRSTPFRGAL